MRYQEYLFLKPFGDFFITVHLKKYLEVQSHNRQIRIVLHSMIFHHKYGHFCSAFPDKIEF